MPKFKHGQLVAVRNCDEFEWKIFIYDHEKDGRHFCVSPGLEYLGATDWEQVCPAEAIWPDIFLSRDYSYTDKSVKTEHNNTNELLTSLEQISKKFKVGKNTIRKWIHQGAPIFKAGRGYKSVFAELYNWIKLENKDNCKQ